MPGPRSLWFPAASLRRGERADGRPAVGSNRPKEIMSWRHKSPRKKKKCRPVRVALHILGRKIKNIPEMEIEC